MVGTYKDYSVLYLKIWDYHFCYKDYSGRSPEEVLEAWETHKTVPAFAGEQSSRIDMGDFAGEEQLITDVPEPVAAPRFSLNIDADERRFSLYYDNKEIVCSLSDAADKLKKGFEHARTTRIFVDMDGVLAKFQQVDTLEVLYEEGYFLNLPPQRSVVDAVRRLVADSDVEVFILSSVLSDSAYALQEKNAWLDTYLPEIDQQHRIFPPCGDNKRDYIPSGLRSSDCLLDDYTYNLANWEPPAKGIKLLNGINHTKGTWKGDMVSHELSGDDLYRELLSLAVPQVEENKKLSR